MSQERLLKRGELAELQDEMRLIGFRAAVQIVAVRVNIDGVENLFQIDIEVSAVALKDLQALQARFREIRPRIQTLMEELGL